MKAILLAAGVGARLRPLTSTVPKCMVPIAGRPLLDIWLDTLASAGVDEVLINLHHLAQIVRDHLDARVGPPATYMVYEAELLGSAGTLIANRTWLRGEDAVLVCNADNLTDFDVRLLVDLHRRSQAVATLALFRAERPSACGIVEVDSEGRLARFTEKPVQPNGDLANAGIYVFDPRLFDEIVGPPPKDIGYDLIPRLIGRAQTMLITGYFQDVGTPEAYASACHDWPLRKQQP